MCNTSCNECPKKVYSASITVGTVGTVSTLLINIPNQTFNNMCKGCLVLVQNIPDTATISMPVAITIGTDTTNAYPVVDCKCTQVTACALRTRVRYPFRVITTAAGGTFKILKNLSCSPTNNLLSIPVQTTTEGG